MALIETGRIGIKGHVVMPASVRRLLGVDQGSSIAWIIQDDGHVRVRALNAKTFELEDEFTRALEKAGLSYSDWRANKSKAFAKAYPKLAKKRRK
jgi:bifunctional DNA-binding transcriptional regulator/antitoxin component of YhaV-PrlF toxin-antitoxin module